MFHIGTPAWHVAVLVRWKAFTVGGYPGGWVGWHRVRSLDRGTLCLQHSQGLVQLVGTAQVVCVELWAQDSSDGRTRTRYVHL